MILSGEATEKIPSNTTGNRSRDRPTNSAVPLLYPRPHRFFLRQYIYRGRCLHIFWFGIQQWTQCRWWHFGRIWDITMLYDCCVIILHHLLTVFNYNCRDELSPAVCHWCGIHDALNQNLATSYVHLRNQTISRQWHAKVLSSFTTYR